TRIAQHREMQMRRGGVAAVARLRDQLSRPHPLTGPHQRRALAQMGINAEGAVIVQDVDIVGLAAERLRVAALAVYILHLHYLAAARRANPGTDRHADVDRIAAGGAVVTVVAVESLGDPERGARWNRRRVGKVLAVRRARIAELPAQLMIVAQRLTGGLRHQHRDSGFAIAGD